MKSAASVQVTLSHTALHPSLHSVIVPICAWRLSARADARHFPHCDFVYRARFTLCLHNKRATDIFTHDDFVNLKIQLSVPHLVEEYTRQERCCMRD